jgi:histidinol-phosphatase (PHP family)
MRLIDAHVHLQPHGEQPPVNRARIECYVEQARRNGLDGIVFTEHLFRFREAYALLAGWWNAEPNLQLRAVTAAYWQDHVNLSLPEYVRLIEDAKRGGLPVSLGLELDWIPGRAEELRALLTPYSWDLVLGSVHWLGGFGIDQEEMLDEWAVRDVDTVFAEYTQLVTGLAGSGLADALAHPDLPKLFGHMPHDPAAFQAQIVAAAVRGGCALEINTNGLNKPIHELYPAPALLRAAYAAGVRITLGSDAHTPARLGEHFDAAVTAAQTAGYEGYARFAGRRADTQRFAD